MTTLTVRAVPLLLLAAVALAPPPAVAADRPASAANRAAPVSTGDIAPDFTLDGQDDRRYKLSAERGRRPVVLVFYRGYW